MSNSPRRGHRWSRARRLQLWQFVLATVVLAAVGVLAAMLFTSRAQSAQERSELRSELAAVSRQAERVADPLAELCRTDPDAAQQTGSEACQLATSIGKRGPQGPQGERGPAGEDGRGIASTAIEDGRLVVTYTDGTSRDVGRVVGQQGPQGEQGSAGRGITGTSIADGALTVSYSDGSTETLGQVVGADGRGIDSVSAEDGQLVITYTDGTETTAGPLPQGPPGPTGERGPRGPAGPTCPDGYERRDVLYASGQSGVGCVATDEED